MAWIPHFSHVISRRLERLSGGVELERDAAPYVRLREQGLNLFQRGVRRELDQRPRV